MNFVEKIDMLLSEKGLNRNQFLSALSLSKNSFVNWTNRGNTPNGDVLLKIADFFDVSSDYLLGKTDIRKPMTQDNISEADNKILTLYHQLPPELQEKYMKDLELLSKLSNNQ